MYNLTYTELFTDTLWPDFSEEEFNILLMNI